MLRIVHHQWLLHLFVFGLLQVITTVAESPRRAELIERESLAVNTRGSIRRDKRRVQSALTTSDVAPPVESANTAVRRLHINASHTGAEHVTIVTEMGTVGRCIRIFAVAIVLAGAARFACMLKAIPDPLDTMSAMLLCGSYVAISATSDVLVKWETQANGGKLPFLPLRMTFVVEFLKLLLTMPLVMGRHSRGVFSWPQQADCAIAIRLMFVPAMAYSANNALIYFLVSRVDFSTLSVWRQMAPLFVAGIWVILFRRQLGAQRWFALSLLVAGTALNSFGQKDGVRFDAMVLVVLGSCFTTAVAGVANEYVLKQCGCMDIDFLCVLLYMQTSTISFFLAVISESRIFFWMTGIAPTPAQAYTLLGGVPLQNDLRPLAIIGLQVLFGFAVARVIRYLGAIPRAVVNALKELTVVLVAPAFTQSHLNSTVAVSAVVVGSAAALFTLAPSPLPASKASRAWSPDSAMITK